MNKPMLAFLVCAYNADKYIEQTIESVLAQTFKDIRLYLLDNGSNDSTYEICKKYADIDERIVLIRNELNGHYVGHNLPHTFDKPLSKYITHLDADDYVDPNFAELTVTQAEKHQADIVVVGSKNFNDGEDEFCSIRTQNELIYNDKDTLSVDELMDKYSQLRPLWAKVYNTDFFYSIDWQEVLSMYYRLLRGHDTTLSICQMLRAKKVVFMNECVHFHRYRSDSDFTDNFMPDYRRVFDGLVIYELGLKLLDKFNCKTLEGMERIRNILYGHLYSLVDLLIDPNNKNYAFKYEFLYKLINDEQFLEVIELLNNENIYKLLKPIFDDLAKELSFDDDIANNFLKKFLYSQYKAQTLATQKLLLISAVYDQNNKYNFGNEELYYWHSKDKIPKWYLKFASLESSQHQELFSDLDNMRNLVGSNYDENLYNTYKNYIVDLIDNGMLNEAYDLNEFMLINKPLDKECLYFKAILSSARNCLEEYRDVSLIIKAYYPEDTDLISVIS